MKIKRPEPFKDNPLTSLDAVRLVDIPRAPETHMPRVALRSYLQKQDELSSFLATLGGPNRPRGKVEIERRIPVKEALPKPKKAAEPGKPPVYGRS